MLPLTFETPPTCSRSVLIFFFSPSNISRRGFESQPDCFTAAAVKE